ncbi:MAG: SAM-dependent methyltransferase [Moraxellaceae bacterium]|nr:MAG: SAM-dependent methyltransferase [Moraxellaceae bacterium]
MPSSTIAYQAMAKLIDETGTGTIIDLGSGWGNFVIPIAKRYPHRQIVGYELSLLPWMASTLIKHTLRLKNLTLYRQDFLNANLSTASVLVCYLSPDVMDKIKNKLLLEKPGVEFLISNNFSISSWKFDKIIQLNDFFRSPVFLYKLDL